MNKGYFSIVQFCPDVARAEAVNIGVVLLSKELNFLDLRIVEDFVRVRVLMPPGSTNKHSVFVKTAVASFRDLLERRRTELTNPEEFEKFIQTRAHEVRLTSLRQTKFEDPKTELSELFSTLVPSMPVKEKRDDVLLFPELEKRLRAPNLAPRIKFGDSVQIPIIGKELTAPYSYMNGHRHLIKPVKIGTFNAAEQLALEGDILQRKTLDKFIVVSKIDIADHDTADRVLGLFGYLGIMCFRQDTLEDLLLKIDVEAHL